MNDVGETSLMRIEECGPSADPLALLHSPEAEQAVLGALLQDPRAFEKVDGLLQFADFFDHAHRTIFDAISTCVSRGYVPDPVTVGERLREVAQLDAVGGYPYLPKLIASVPSAASIAHYAKIVRDKAQRRAWLAAADEIVKTANHGPDAGAVTTVVVQLVGEVAASGDGINRAAPAWIRRMQEWHPLPMALDEVPPRIEHAVQDLIRTGKVGALVAAGGTGKTTLLLHLAACHATGRPFLGLAVTVGTFVLLSNDDPVEDLQMALAEVAKAMELNDAELELVARRVRLFSLQGESGLRVFTAAGFGGAVVGTGLEKLLLEAVEGITDLVGLALDTLRQFSGGSSNDEQVVKLTIQATTDFATRTGAYVILPHHTGKQNFRDGVADLYCGSGSAAIADNCRFVLLLQATSWADIEDKVKRTGRELGDPLALLSTRGSLLMRPAETVFFCRDGFDLQRIAGAVMSRDEAEDRRDSHVLAAVRKGEGKNKTAICLAVRERRTTCFRRIAELMERGHLEQNGSGEFVLTGTGAKLLDQLQDGL